MQACGDNVHWWKKYNKKYGVFQQKKELNNVKLIHVVLATQILVFLIFG